MSDTAPTISVIGAGAWGSALADAFSRKGLDVTLWARHEKSFTHQSANVEHTTDLAQAAAAHIILMAVPTQVTRQVCALFTPLIKAQTHVIACAKGIEQSTGLYLTDVIGQTLSTVQPALLSGPGFAQDVIAGLPTAVTIAANDLKRAEYLAKTLSSSHLRLYHTDDVRGVEIGGAAKNVLAIAAGIVSGKGLGESAKAALIARGFAELIRFAAASNVQTQTLIGLSGLGDLILTCNSEKSRNYALGLALGRGEPLDNASGGKLVEGVYTASILHQKAQQLGVDMPIIAAVDAVLSRQWPLEEAVRSLMSRPQRAEF